MRRDQLEHVLRAAAAIVDEDDFVVIGSQAMLASVQSPPPVIVASVEVDLYPRQSPERAIEIDDAIGDRDVEYARATLTAGIVDPVILRERVGTLDVDDARRSHVADLITIAEREP